MSMLTRKDARPRARSRSPVIALLAALLTLAVASPALAVDPTAQDAQRKAAATVNKEAVKEAVKIWSVWGIFETHWTVVHDNQTANDVYHTLYLYGNIDPPKMWRSRFSLRLDLNRKYIADPGESGVLFGDLRLYYSRPFEFKIKGQEFAGRGYFYWTFPTSKISQQEGNIARPTVLFSFIKELPYGFTVMARPFFRLNWAKYAEKEGGAPNQKWDLGYDLWLMYEVPIHKRLSFGAIWGQDWFNFYEGRDSYTQPWASNYFWEVYSGYSIFTKPVAFDAMLSVTSGRKTMEDGVWRFHFTDRDETEMYFTLRAMY